MKDIVNVSVVNFHPIWGEKERNLKRIEEYIECEARKGNQVIVFPELCLTGYDDEDTDGFGLGHGNNQKMEIWEKMQFRAAEEIPGPSSERVAAVTRKYGVYAAFGMTEKKAETPDVVYNSVAVCGPEGVIGSYQKIHIPPGEMYWAAPGETPLLFDTPWGPVGVQICFDAYFFPEITRYYRAKGARLLLNCTALAGGDIVRYPMCSREIENSAYINTMYIASSNLCGKDKYSSFLGGSSIIGPSAEWGNVHYYAGGNFHDKEFSHPGTFSATLDLTQSEVSQHFLFRPNPVFQKPDFRPELYAKLYNELQNDSHWRSLDQEDL